MKMIHLIAILFSFVFISCNNVSFNIGDCIQQPDSTIVWTVKSKKDNSYTLYQNQDKRRPSLVTQELEGHWSKTNCIN